MRYTGSDEGLRVLINGYISAARFLRHDKPKSAKRILLQLRHLTASIFSIYEKKTDWSHTAQEDFITEFTFLRNKLSELKTNFPGLSLRRRKQIATMFSLCDRIVRQLNDLINTAPPNPAQAIPFPDPDPLPPPTPKQNSDSTTKCPYCPCSIL